jgi:hypothetical protein
MNASLMISGLKNFFKQDVNSYICIALVALMAFWTCLCFFVHKAEAFGNALSDNMQISKLK